MWVRKNDSLFSAMELGGDGLRQPLFAVYCRRHDGVLRAWNRYATAAEAQMVASHLSALSCPSVVRREEVAP